MSAASNPKTLRFAGGSDEIRTPPMDTDARLETGRLLRRLQNGELLSLPQSRPMPSIGSSVHELRVRDAQNNWRIVYFFDADDVLILEVFPKKTQETPQEVIDICKKRLSYFLQAKQRKTKARKP